MAGPLAGVRVLDFTHALAGPFGTMILTDLGAEVINVERVTVADETRGNEPFINGRSTYRFSIERGKKNIQVDLKRPEGLDIILRLADKCDVIAENFSPGTMDDLGIGYDVVSRRNPRIIFASCSGFGQWGPYSKRGALDVIAQAMSGFMSITGEPDGRPMRAGASIGDTLGGTFMAMGVISALYEREKSGLGQRIDVSMVESVIYNMENAIIRASVGETPARIGPRHPLLTPFQSFPTRDGWIVICGVRDWEAFCLLLGLPELAHDQRFVNSRIRHQHHGELEPLMNEALKKKTTAEWLELLSEVTLAAPLYTVPEMMDDPHIQARGVIVTLPVPGPQEGVTVKVPNSPVRMSRTPPVVDKPGPAVGEHTREVLRDIVGMGQEEIERLERAGVVKSKGETREGGQTHA
ncbi:MAG: CoA transferase [Chloroflexi bacterium]|nr:CoA transferase [Chloroflexota bacterium]